MSSKLPPRHYYTLAQAARELDCAEDHLLHLGATGRLAIHQLGSVEGKLLPLIRAKPEHYQSVSDEQISKAISHLDEISALYVAGDVFVQLFPSTLRDLELYGAAQICSFKDMVSIYPPMDFLLISHADDISAVLFGANRETSKVFLAGFQFKSYADDGDPPFTSIEVDQRWLFVLAPELDRLKRGEAATPISEPPPEVTDNAQREPSAKRRNAYTLTIAALSQALLRKPLDQPYKDAITILAAIAEAGIEPPIKEDALARYLKDAGEVEKKAKG